MLWVSGIGGRECTLAVVSVVDLHPAGWVCSPFSAEAAGLHETSD
jgi:hypothetical protein